MKMLNKIIGGSSIAIAAALAFSASTTQAQNLLVNPGFDLSGAGNFTPNPISLTSDGGSSGINRGWATFGGTTPQSDMSTSADSPLSSPYALLVIQTPGSTWNAYGGYQIVSITPGQQYTYSMWVLTDTGVASTYATPVDLQLGFLNASLTTNGFASTFGNWTGGGFNAAFTPTANDTWQQKSVTVTAPINAAYAGVYAMFMQNGTQAAQQTMYFDNASLTATPEPASLALVGMGLASFYLIRRRKS